MPIKAFCLCYGKYDLIAYLSIMCMNALACPYVIKCFIPRIVDQLTVTTVSVWNFINKY